VAERRQTGKRLKSRGEKRSPDKRVITGMQTELRTHILVLLNERVASRPEIRKELDADFEAVRYEMRVLDGLGLIREKFRKEVRGNITKFYEATARACLDRAEWEGVPDSIKGSMRAPLFKILVDDAAAAIEANSFDSLEAAHMSWTPMIVDAQGWEELTQIMERALNDALKVRNESCERLASSHEKGSSCTLSILLHGSDNEDRTVEPSHLIDSAD
jgi:hypothetical protein